MPYIEELGQQMLGSAANAGAGGLIGMAFQGAADRRQIRQQKKLNALDYALHTQKGDYNAMKQLEMWEKTGYVPTVDQMKRAGLNPSMLYGGSGPGGSTQFAAPGGGNTGAPVGGGEAIHGMGLMIQGGLQAAQIKLMNEQAENLKADTENKRGLERDLGAGTLSEIAATVKNKDAQTAILKIDKELKDLQLKFESNTVNYEAKEDLLMHQLEQAAQITKSLTAKAEVDRNTQVMLVDKMRTELVALGLQNQLTKEQINLTTEEAKAVAAKILQGWEELSIEDQKNVIAREVNEVAKDRLSMDKAVNASERIRGWVETATNVLPWKKTTTPLRGFHNR